MLPILVLALQAFLWGHGAAAATTTQGSTGIVPKSKAKGVDFCGADTFYYIIRSEQGLYMKSSNFHEAKDIQIFPLHNSVRGGDHYLGHKDDLFYVIKRNDYRRVSNLNKDSGAVVYSLHPNCRNGDHYFSSGDYFYIVFKAKGVIRRVTNMHEDLGAKTFPIHEAFKNCLYFWGTKDYVYCLKPTDKWGVQYHKASDVEKNSDPVTYSFHDAVVAFLPGGLSITHGKCFSLWKRVSVIRNDASISVTREYSITKKIGFERGKVSNIEHHWGISYSATAGTGDILAAFVQAQISLEANYGGVTQDTTHETWTEATEVTEKITFTVPPKKSIYVWQYTVGMGKDDILHSGTAMAFTDTAVPPAMNPYEPPKN